MENQTYPTWKHAMLFGVYLGAGLIVLSLVFYILDLYAQRWTGYISYALILGLIIISSIHFRDKYLDGFISYGSSVSVGFQTGFYASIIAAIFTFVFISVLGEGYTDLLLEQAEEKMLEARPNMSDEELDMAISWSKKMMQPWWLSIIVMLSNTFFSLIFALIVSIFVKKEAK